MGRHRLLFVLALLAPSLVHAEAPVRCEGSVFEDRDGNGRRDAGEAGVAGVAVSDGVAIVATDAGGRYALAPGSGRGIFVIKPAGFDAPRRTDGLPDTWRGAGDACGDFALRPRPARAGSLDVLVFADPQPKSRTDVDYYARDIVDPIVDAAGHRRVADLGLTLGDVVSDDLSLYPELKQVTARMGVPWLHAPGNHDLDLAAGDDMGSLATFRHHFGPDTYAWEAPQANFVLLDDVIYRPGRSPAYIGGLRDDQFRFLEAYLDRAPRDRLLVLGAHIPFFDAAPGRETFRHADRDRLFALLRPFPKVLLVTGHSHTQQHVWHDAADGWHGAAPLHEYNVGAACGAFWSGVKDAAGIPDTTMADGTPNGFARLRIADDGSYSLAWQPARLQPTDARTPSMSLHAPRVLRRGAWPGVGLFANVYMGDDGTRVEYRIDGGEWVAMKRVDEADPWLLAQNAADDAADALRGYDRATEAKPSRHLWRVNLPTDLDGGGHRVEVRAFDRWQGEQHAATTYRLVEAVP